MNYLEQAHETELKKFLDGVQGICYADREHQHFLWHKMTGYDSNTGKYDKEIWKENLHGLGRTIGHLSVKGRGRQPVFIAINTAIVRGTKILFIDATSQVVDWVMIDNWREEYLPGIPHDTPANFHNLLVNPK